MVVNGSNISIRTFCETDVVPFYDAAIESVEHMHEFMPWCHPDYSIEESESWVTSRKKAWDCGDEYSFVIESANKSELLGGVAINQINKIHKIGNIGYWVRKKALNNGYASEAVSLIMRFGFKTLKLNRLEIVTLPNNTASNKVANRVGAKYEGILHSRLIVHGKPLDACIYSLVNDK